ncbi:MAG: hypothetical protein JW976_12480 [Syntrophaceae bacterium]|nr:hypothetical protein [Syntrophaceae bacterium]
MKLLEQYFFYIDFAIGAAVPLIVVVLYAAKKISPFTWKLFWIGTAIGFTWEVPLSTLDGLGIVDIFTFLRTPPAHFIFIIISHTFWDGGLFLIGVWLVNIFCREPRFASFSAQELSVLIIWGQAQELGVELLSTGLGGWGYNPAWWNPSLFLFNGRHITLAPQLIWLAAPVLFYFAALALKKKIQ